MIAILLAGYFLLGNLPAWAGRGEIFPFASWDLFSYVPAPDSADYSLRILAVNGAELEQPVYFEQAGHLFARARSIDANNAISALGTAVMLNDQAAIEAKRALIEPVYLGDAGQVRYALVHRTYNLLERWRHGAFASETTIAVFDTAQRR